MLGPHRDEGVAVAIDGTIYQDALLEPLGPDSEVFASGITRRQAISGPRTPRRGNLL